ncbi:putative transmembrane protein [Gregarina niphandrodes]|uniref:Transmembrane protein n=1 Tax=Gregarina niphandrodes TaxID=110365 RepID=A0A023B3R7_GRENI|nr:putative transmembrane protein [Gregarina niphandrodes]EZG55862.1 putative transmembrane protein [Gregarina niphandrodes]|eukprot:XP_011131433.1 putative transmembrane protein [Gregarina niphandrodes]
MAEFGQTGKWLVVPVKLCVAFLGAYYVFSAFFGLGSMIFSGLPMMMTIHDTGTIFGAEPSMEFLERFPESGGYPLVPWMGQLYSLEMIVMSVAGFFTLCVMLCAFSVFAKLLYFSTLVYGGVWFTTHLGLLYCYQKRFLLDFVPGIRGQREFQALVFGELTWPSSFWYQYAAKLIFNLYVTYAIADLYYSYYLILKAGGSGWELLPAEELPGWDRYQAKIAHKWEDDQEQGPRESGPRPEELQALLEQLQRMQANGEVPAGMLPQGMMPPGMMPQGMMPQGMMPQGAFPRPNGQGPPPPQTGITVREE